MSEQVPEGWEKKRLSDFSTARRGTTYVSSELSEDKERFPLYINMKSFKVGGGYSENGDKYFTSPYSPNQLVQDNDLLIANTDVTDSCDILGAPAYVPREKLKNDVLFSHHVSALNISDDVSLDFLNFLMCSEHIRLEMKRYGRGTTVKMLDMRDIGKISLSIPPLPEQKKIASILTSVDEVIEKTQSQIDKLQDLKKGTMNELLTKGIGHTEFKDSELGKIPKSWEIKRLIDLSVNGISNGVFNDPKKVGSGYKLINVTEMYQKFGFDEDQLKRISLEEKEFLKNKINYGDILFTRSSLVLEGISHCNICLSHSDDITYDGHLMRVRPNKSIIDPVFLAYFAIINISRTFFMRMAKQSTMTTIGQEDIAPLPVLVPPLEEQIKIVSIISQITMQLINLQKKLHQTQSLKKSLMQDLLTGKVRVSVN
jgi:type I restriction enzyme, S subunit